MASNVNPPPQIRLPKAFQQDNEIQTYFRHIDRVMLQLWKRTGGADDLIDEAAQNITSSSSRVSRNAAKIDALEFIRFTVVSVTQDYTAKPFEIVICYNTIPITITLEPNAVSDDQIHVKRKSSASQVTVSGSVDGATSRVMNIKNWSELYVFDGLEWAVI